MIFNLLSYVLGDPRIFVPGMRSLDIPLLCGEMFKQVTMYCTSYIVINFVNCFYGMEWQPHLTRYLIVCMDHSMYPMFSFVAHMCRFAGDKKYWIFQIHCLHRNQ